MIQWPAIILLSSWYCTKLNIVWHFACYKSLCCIKPPPLHLKCLIEISYINSILLSQRNCMTKLLYQECIEFSLKIGFGYHDAIVLFVHTPLFVGMHILEMWIQKVCHIIVIQLCITDFCHSLSHRGFR